jgi:uncharacterized protein (TIGR04222 family)
MNFLLDNPVANMRGPEFLIFYAVVAVLAIVWALRCSWTSDDTRRMDVPQLPVEFDPFEIAYLRGGVPELGRLIILDLIARKYLQAAQVKGFLGSSKRMISAAPGHPETSYLDSQERIVFQWLKGGRDAEKIFPELPRILESTACVQHYQQELEERRLLSTEGQRGRVWRAIFPALCLLAGLAAYKLFVALSRGKTNVLFLIGLSILSIVCLVAFSRPRRLTTMGRAYLEHLQTALGTLKGRVSQLAAGGVNDHLILAVSAFGIATLQGTGYAYYPEMFKRAAQQSTSGCGSSSGSGCGASSGCGSGCGGGGCGGGGCGGCGGGS